jgi:Ser/Thr protein kinase RdoA (MazF antagonist)
MPEPRHVELSPEVAAEVAGVFGLGSVVSVSLAARGWVSINVLWRFETTTGTWAVKEVTRESQECLEAAAHIELAAENVGIAVPPIVSTSGGRICAVVDDRVFRCHAYRAGVVPTDDLQRDDAVGAGRALGRLHRLALTWDPVLQTGPNVYGSDHWRRLVEDGERVGASWVPSLRAALPDLLARERAAAEWFNVPRRWIGSHRDVRPDNTIRTAEGIVLVDWDGAGPVVQGAEVANALGWWEPHGDAFLAAYTDVAGDVDLNEGKGESGALIWWLETNVGHALASPHDEERAWAVSALAGNFLPR